MLRRIFWTFPRALRFVRLVWKASVSGVNPEIIPSKSSESALILQDLMRKAIAQPDGPRLYDGETPVFIRMEMQRSIGEKTTVANYENTIAWWANRAEILERQRFKKVG